MTQRAIIIASFIGLACAVAAALLISRAASVQSIDLVVGLLDVIAAAVAGRVVLGRRRVHRYFSLGLVLLSAIAALVITSATTNYIISQAVTFGPPNRTPTVSIVVSAVVGLVIYLVAATIYGFAGTRQGIAVGARVGLLLLLLLAVLPVLNVLGLIGLTITAFTRKVPDATREPVVTSA